MTSVRAIDRNDLDRVAEIEQACFSNPWAREALEAEIARSWAGVLVARDEALEGAPIVGFLHYWLVADEIHVLNVATDPSHRRRGHARSLIDTLFDTARTRRTRVILLEVRASNTAAIALYAARGFRQNGTRPRYYDDGEDAVLMIADVGV